MKTKHTYPEYLQASKDLADLAAAFATGGPKGVHDYADKHDIFERLSPHFCQSCGQAESRDPLLHLFALVESLRSGVRESKARAAVSCDQTDLTQPTKAKK